VIPLVKDTISKEDIDTLIAWLKTNPRLTKGERTVEFEKAWSEWLGVKHSVFVNSGSSANLAMVYATMLKHRLRNKKIVVPAVSWTTTVTPAIHLGLEPILCDCNLHNLGVDTGHLERLFEDHKPAILIIVHVLGFPCDMDKILELCNRHGVILLEDSCECVGTTFNGKQCGTFGHASSFSFYYGHHMSTIEGGMICTNDDNLYETLKSIRSHGWDRDMSPEVQKELRRRYNVSDFRAFYTFYLPGFNLRATDLQAIIGLEQLRKLNKSCQTRKRNFDLYSSLIKDTVWKPTLPPDSFISNFAYPIISKRIEGAVSALQQNGVECRPLICGSIGEQPYWIDRYGKQELPSATYVHHYGFYVPNNQDMTVEEVEFIAGILNKEL